MTRGRLPLARRQGGLPEERGKKPANHRAASVEQHEVYHTTVAP